MTVIESFISIPRKILKDKGLTPAAKLLYGEIRALEQGQVGLCEASTDKLAYDTGLNRRTVERAISQLEAAGVVTRKRYGRRKVLTTSEWASVF